MNGVSGDKQSAWLCLDTSHLFLHIATKLVMVLVILYNEDIPSPNGGRRCPAAFTAMSGSQFWQCLGDQVGTVSWVGSTIQMLGVCTIHSHSLSVAVHWCCVFHPTGIKKPCAHFPCVFIQWGCYYSVDAVLVCNFLYW